MSTTNLQPDEPQVSPTTDDPIEFTDHHTTPDHVPTREEERAARIRTRAMGNRTFVGLPDDNERTERYDTLDSHNRDNAWKYREEVEVSKSADTQFKQTTLLAFAHHLSLSPLQRQVALTRFLELDLPRCGHRTELVAFCVCAVVCNEDVEGYFGEAKPYYPTRSPENNHSGFTTLQERLIERWGAITTSRIHSVYQKVRQQSLPTSAGDHSAEAKTVSEEVQHHPSHCPEWALPKDSDTPI